MTLQISRLSAVIGVIVAGLFIASQWLSPIWQDYAVLLVFSSEAIRAGAVSRRTTGLPKIESLIRLRTALTFLTVLMVQMLLMHGPLTRKAVDRQSLFAMVIAYTLGYAQVFWYRRQDARSDDRDSFVQGREDAAVRRAGQRADGDEL